MRDLFICEGPGNNGGLLGKGEMAGGSDVLAINEGSKVFKVSCIYSRVVFWDLKTYLLGTVGIRTWRVSFRWEKSLGSKAKS